MHAYTFRIVLPEGGKHACNVQQLGREDKFCQAASSMGPNAASVMQYAYSTEQA